MGRRRITQRENDDPSATTNDKNDRDYYNRRYQEIDKKRGQIRNYETSTEYHIDRMENIWKEYCKIVDIEPRHNLRKARTERINNFFHWLCRTYTVSKVSSVITYWHQLSQLYAKYKGRRINPSVTRNVFAFIEGALAQEHSLSSNETDKPLLDAEDLLEVFRCHWVTDTNSFPQERQRVQVATLLLLAAMTGSRPGALLGICYEDIGLFVLRDEKTGQDTLTLHLRLTKTKSQKKRNRPKTYTFFADEMPVFCVISHIVALAFHDEAFGVAAMTPQNLFDLGVRPGMKRQQIPWRDDVGERPIFCAPTATCATGNEDQVLALPYHLYQGWVKRLGEETGFVKVLTTYCLRRAAGNAINDDPDSNAAVRNLVLDHGVNSNVFQRNYLSRMIRYDTQAAYLGRTSRTDLIVASHRMSRDIDPRRPRGPSIQDRQDLRQHPSIQKLQQEQEAIRQMIKTKYGRITDAKGQAIHDRYIQARRDIQRLHKKQLRALKADKQARYDKEAPLLDLRAQLAATDASPLSPVTVAENPVSFVFEERSRLAESFFGPQANCNLGAPSKQRASIVADLTALCGRQERRPRQSGQQGQKCKTPARPSDNISDGDIKSEGVPPPPKEYPIRCHPHQCLYCISDVALPDCERRHIFGSTYSLQRHFDRFHEFKPGQSCPFPDRFCGFWKFNDIWVFKNHVATIHGIKMSEKS